MTAEAWIAMGFGAAGLVLNMGVVAVGYGVLKGTVSALTTRVVALEGEMRTLNDLKNEVTRIGTRQETWIEQLKEINASIRWMRQPAEYEAPDGVSPQRRK